MNRLFVAFSLIITACAQQPVRPHFILPVPTKAVKTAPVPSPSPQPVVKSCFTEADIMEAIKLSVNNTDWESPPQLVNPQPIDARHFEVSMVGHKTKNIKPGDVILVLMRGIIDTSNNKANVIYVVFTTSTTHTTYVRQYKLVANPGLDDAGNEVVVNVKVWDKCFDKSVVSNKE